MQIYFLNGDCAERHNSLEGVDETNVRAISENDLTGFPPGGGGGSGPPHSAPQGGGGEYPPPCWQKK